MINRYIGCGISVSCILLLGSLFLTGCQSSSGKAAEYPAGVYTDSLPVWMLGPFIKVDSVNPCLSPDSNGVFNCPVRNSEIKWQVKDVFNPAVIAQNGLIEMLFRAEDSVGIFAGTSRLGLAQSIDGFHFIKRELPVLFPDRDQMFQFEWEGGCEDPRIVKRRDGLYVMTYTSNDGKVARLCVASSRDLQSWTKNGLAFASVIDDKYANLWSKSGSIVSEYDTLGTIVARQIKGSYWMYWGDKDIYLATSKDLLSWKPVTDSSGALKKILSPRSGKFDSDLVEPGPPAIARQNDILLIYNSRNYGAQRDTVIPEGTYSAGQAAFDLENPEQLLRRSDKSFFAPDREYEIKGQVNRVVFLEGLLRLGQKWFLYYGTADSDIAVAIAQE